MSDMGLVLIVEDDASLREAMCSTLELGGYETRATANGADALKVISREDVRLIISDVQMPEMDGHALLSRVRQHRPEVPFVIVTAHGSIEKAVEAIQSGAADYLVKPFDGEVLLEVAGRFVRAGQSTEECGLVAEDELTLNVMRLAGRVATSDATVMITGESGTGKEVFARYIHDNSTRADGPFIAINCAAIPETMLESILFGYEKGAFTGAYRSREGKFEQADGGTILLDEISEMDVGLQAKLLRVLQEKEVERLGGSKSVSLDVRVLATTNRNLKQQVLDGQFREDLYYRLNVFPLKLPSLRERTGDLLPLARYFSTKFSDSAVMLDDGAETALLRHSWPGNVRELENVMHRADILKSGPVITADDISFELDACTTSGGDDASGQNPMMADGVLEAPAAYNKASGAIEDDVNSLESDLKVKEQHLILDALKAERGNKRCAAERLGISPRTLRYKLAKFRKEGVCLPELASA